jgi:hypothetical protein
MALVKDHLWAEDKKNKLDWFSSRVTHPSLKRPNERVHIEQLPTQLCATMKAQTQQGTTVVLFGTEKKRKNLLKIQLRGT